MAVGLAVLLYGLAALSVFGALATIARIGKPKAEIQTGGGAVVSTLFSVGYVVVFCVAANLLLQVA